MVNKLGKQGFERHATGQIGQRTIMIRIRMNSSCRIPRSGAIPYPVYL